MLLDSEIMAWSKLYVVGKVVTWLIGLKSNVGGWMRAQRHLYKKVFCLHLYLMGGLIILRR